MIKFLNYQNNKTILEALDYKDQLFTKKKKELDLREISHLQQWMKL